MPVTIILYLTHLHKHACLCLRQFGPRVEAPFLHFCYTYRQAERKARAEANQETSLPEEEDDEDEEVLVKRARNNLAAKRYRQKKVDRIEGLEDEVKEVKKERDDLRVELARREAEVKALREMLAMTTGKKD